MSVPLMLRATEREARVWARLWRSGVFTEFVAPVLLLVAMGIGLGALVDESQDTVDGLDYLVFITPGLLVATGVQAAAGNSMWPVMAGHRWLGFHNAMVASPIGASDIYGGLVIWTVLRTMLAGAVFLAAGAALGGVLSWWGLLAVPISGLTAAAFAAPLTAYAATQDFDAAFNVIIRVVIVPLYLFSGTLFPVEELPALLRLLTTVFPLYHGVELARAATTGRSLGAVTLLHVVVLLTYVAIGWRWGRATFRRRLTP